MTNRQRPEKEVWQRTLLRPVLVTHNSSFGTDLEIVARAEDLFPELEGTTNWDWVWLDHTSNELVAVEFKRLTNPLAERTVSDLRKIGEELDKKMKDSLDGHYLLTVDTGGRGLSLDRKSREQLIDTLAMVVAQRGHSAMPGISEEIDLPDELMGVLPPGFSLSLRKIDPSELKSGIPPFIRIQPSWAWSLPIEHLPEKDYVGLHDLIEAANKQLAVARQRKVQDTILVIAEIGYSGAQPKAVKNALDNIPTPDYCYIDHIYFLTFGLEASRLCGSNNAR